MNIGELFVQIGAKVDSSWIDGMNKLKGMGTAAKQAAAVASGAMAQVRSSMNWAARDAASAADKVVAASKREAAAVEASARRQAFARARLAAMRSPGGQAIGQLRSNLAGIFETDAGPGNARRPVTWGQVHAAMGLPPSLQRFSNGSAAEASPMAMVPGGGRLRKFRPGSGGGMFGEGDPFTPPVPPTKPPRTRGGGGGGGGGRRGRGGYHNRLGPLGDIASIRRVILGAGLYQGATQFGQLADSYINLQNRIGGITKSQGEANAVFERLYNIANRTRSGIDSTAEAYVRIHNATDGMKLSQEDQFKLIERINMAFATSGASASEARSGMMQLTQALAKGKLDGDEFRSIAENMPNVLKILEKSLGVTEGRLRAMSRAGELTREKIVKAFLGAGGLEDAFNKTNATFGQTYEVFKNQLIKAFGELAQDKDLVQAFAFALQYLAKAIILIVKVVTGALTGIQKFVEAFKNGETWAYALAAAITVALLPSIVNLLAYLVKLPIAFAEAAAAGRLFGALGGGAGGAAGAAGKAAGGGLGLLGLLGGVALPIAAAYIGVEATGGPIDFWGEHGMVNQAKSRMGGGQEVNIGPTSVTIYAKDGKDAREQFEQSEVERMMRHAAAAWNRRGS